MFVNFIDRKLIELMPDLIEMDHVHLDGIVTFLYYNVLYHGCSITASTKNPSDIKYTKDAYICCMRALPGWQQEATGSTTDLIAALSMVTICAESFDFELGWQMYELACDYARGLNLHSLDAVHPSSINRDRISDVDRKGFWEFIQIDLVIQLLFDKPPSFTATTWKVNMPWLDPNSQPKERIGATLFLARSRISFVLMRFLALLKSDGNPEDLVQKTEDLCREIQELYTQGRLGKWLLSSAESEADVWKVFDATLTGYTCILFMLRRAEMHGHTSPASADIEIALLDCPVALDAARHIVETSEWLLTRYPWPSSVSALFGAFKIHIAYSMLVNAVCRAPDVLAYATEIRILHLLGDSIIRICGAEREFAQLVHAGYLNARVKART
ncbi:hypothetical protein BJY01DRAFT_251108 [Aspergillus pseudoustus]|uniref:Transcription factor domain-containing protein n=1 Tax=Aspergillus pseudoustus TaxID=1810923 RepID=A0ABR4JDH7_9EURO